ncbi:MAG: hypothetical protein J2P37_06655 [Ktedonobacteraceae bacterium]|nr:hypothetical protein [Ktedonobacteraceae bacterium]MBO0795353.1 hypothetical protein [Ktedonobacteraceae bacterium]
MDGREIEGYLQELGEELVQRGFTRPLRVLLVGGVYMLLVAQSRQATEDIDIMLLDLPDTTHKTPETKAFQAAVNAIARRHKMKRHWLNDDVAYFIRDMCPNPEPTLWRTFGILDIYVPASACMLALKLMTYRPKDEPDIVALLQTLQVTTREQAQAILDRYIPDPAYQEHYMVSDTLDDLFD